MLFPASDAYKTDTNQTKYDPFYYLCIVVIIITVKDTVNHKDVPRRFINLKNHLLQFFYTIMNVFV